MGYSLSYPFVLPCGNFIVELLGSESMLNCMKRRINFIPRSRSAERSEFIISSRVTRARSTWTACGSKRGANSQLSSLLVYIRWCPPWRHTVVWRHGAFLFLGNIRLKAISNSINDHSIHEELSFHRLQNNVYYRWISSHFSCKQNSKHKNAELSIPAGEDLTPKNPLERERPLQIQRRKQQRWRRHQQTAEQREHHSMNFEC